MLKSNILVVFGGKSEEYEVSLRSSVSVLRGIQRHKYNIYLIGITKEGKMLLPEFNLERIANDTWSEGALPVKIDFSTGCVDSLPKIDVALPIVHGSFCEDGRLQSLFELLGVRYVGADTLSSALCMHKGLTKRLASTLGIPVARGFEVDRIRLSDINGILKGAKNIGYPVFVKPCSSGSSRGASPIMQSEELLPAIKEAFKYSDSVLIEELINGKECEIGALELPTGELRLSCVGALRHGGKFYDYNEKYINGTTKYEIPASIPPEISEKIRDYAHTLFRFFNLRGLARLDFFVTENGKIYFNEINTLPGFTEASMYPMLFNLEGYTMGGLIDALIDTCVNKI